MQKNRGFTIVELLVVIVVVAILTMVGIVAYGGMQAKARAVAVEETVDRYRDALVQYALANRQYPRAAADFCVGPVSSYTSGCYDSATTDAAVEVALKSVMSTLPGVDTSCNMMGTDCRRNLTVIYRPTAKLDAVTHPYYTVYFLQKNQTCKLDGNVGGSWLNFSSAAPSTGYFERDSSSQVSMCVIALPNPSKM